MKLLLDEQISGKVAAPLREERHYVLAVTEEPSLRGLSDPEVFEIAQQQGRAVVTLNVSDFVPIAVRFGENRRRHHGLVLAHPTRFPSGDFGRLAAALSVFLKSPPSEHSFVIWLKDARRGTAGP